MNMAQNWEAPFTGMSMGSVSGALGGFVQVGTETTSVARWNSLMVWEGGTPPTFTLPVTFIALFDPFTEVSGAIAAYWWSNPGACDAKHWSPDQHH